MAFVGSSGGKDGNASNSRNSRVLVRQSKDNKESKSFMVKAKTMSNIVMANPIAKYSIYSIGVLLLFVFVVFVFRRIKSRLAGVITGKTKQPIADKIVDKSTAKQDKAVNKQEGKNDVKFLKDPIKWNEFGIKRTNADRNEIKKYMKEHSGALPQRVLDEIDRVTANNYVPDPV